MTLQALAATAPPTPEWVHSPWDLTAPHLLRWAALVLMAALAWEARRLVLVPFSTIRATTLGSAPKNPEMTLKIFKVLELHED